MFTGINAQGEGEIHQEISKTNLLAQDICKLILDKTNLHDVSITDRTVRVSLQTIYGINKFYAHFPINIGEIEYKILVFGEIESLKKYNGKYVNRTHPFDQKSFHPNFFLDCFRGDIIRGDITPEMEFSLIKDCEKINVSDEFWKKLRNRIPINHVLSLIPQH